MMVDALVGILLAGIYVTGYTVGRARPLRAVIEWNWRRVLYSSRANWADVALFAVFNPGEAWHVWRTRNDPPLTYHVPRVNPKWLEERGPSATEDR